MMVTKKGVIPMKISPYFIIIHPDEFMYFLYLILVGGLEHGFYDFPFSWECHHRK